jgi:hypothetical protein
LLFEALVNFKCNAGHKAYIEMFISSELSAAQRALTKQGKTSGSLSANTYNQ